MTHSENTLEHISKLYELCGNAFLLIKNGNEKQAKEQFPMEYHFLKKYRPADSDELTSIFNKKLELH